MYKSVPVLLAAGLAAVLLGGCSTTSAGAPALMKFSMGEKIPVGPLYYTVFETQWQTSLGTGPSARIPQNRFFLIRLTAVNSSSDNQSVPNLTLEDDHGRTYDEIADGEGVPQWIGYLRTVHPADSLQGNILFDVTPGHYKLKLADSDRSHGALVDIPLSFGAETPEILTPGDPRKQ